jgi:hypothetical protein
MNHKCCTLKMKIHPNFPFHANDHFLTDTTKDEKWLVLVGRPPLAASHWRALRPAPPSYFHINLQSKTMNSYVILNGAPLRCESRRPEREILRCTQKDK